MSNITTEQVKSFAGSVFKADEKNAPLFETRERHVRKTAKSEAKTIVFKAPVLKVDHLQFAIALATAKAGVATEHKVKTKNEDGTETESVVKSTLLADEVNEFILDRAEDADDAYLKNGKIVDYFGSFIGGVSKDRETEKSVTDKVQKLRADYGDLRLLLDTEGWDEAKAQQSGCADREAAETKAANLAKSIVQFRAKLSELQAAKAKRDSAKADKPAAAAAA